MVLKADIEKAYAEQQKLLNVNNKYIVRNYLKNFKPSKNFIEVITGIRRCGKSTLMKLIIKKDYRNVVFFNFEDSRVFGFDVQDFKKFDEVIHQKPEAYFFDEIQNVASWEIYIRQLHESGAKVFITGSNATLLSKELGTRLTGRHIRHEMFPFSYNEFLLFKKKRKSLKNILEYIEKGGFPEYLFTENTEILQHLLKDIVLRDIAVRYGIRNTKILMDITLFLLSNVGKECSYNAIKKTFGLGSANSAAEYLSWLEDSYLLFFLPRFSWSPKNISVNPRKVYAIDNGMITCNTLSFTEDKGRLLENLTYQYLRQQGYTLYYFRENKECDFVVFENRKCKMLVQVCWQIDGDTFKRETEGLIEAMKYFKVKEGIIVTLNQKDKLNLNGNTIHLIPVSDFIE